MYWKTETLNPKPSLQELIRGFMEYATDQGYWQLPKVNDRAWHEFLWKLKELKGKFPVLDCVGEFDWDGPYSKNRDIQQVFAALSIGAIYSVSHYDGRMVLNTETQRLPNPLELFDPDLAKKMLELAKTIPDFFTN